MVVPLSKGVTMFSRTRTAGLAVLAMLLTAGLLLAAEGGTLKVTVSYEGDGEVSATHPIIVEVADTPFTPWPKGSTIRSRSHLIKRNDQTITFENLSWSPVYVVALYFDKDLTSAQGPGGSVPVAAGRFSESPMGIYGAGVVGSTGAIEMGDGQTIEIDLHFDDTVRGPVIP